jgi:hypothetical protein
MSYGISSSRWNGLLLALVLVVLGMIGFALLRGAPRSSPTKGTEVATASEPVQASSRTDQHDNEDRLEALAQQPAPYELFRHDTAHFDAPTMRDTEHFIDEATLPEIDASCASRASKPDTTRALEQQLREDFSVSANARVPEQVFFEDLTQFFRVDNRYFQFTARALTGSRPPRYSFELYSAGDPLMTTQLLRERLPVAVVEPLDAPEVAFMLTALQNHYLNAQWGARLLQVHIPGATDGADQEIRFVNGGVAQWAFGGGLCQLAADRQRALCRCLPEGETHPIPQS